MQNDSVPTLLIWLFAISQLLYLGCFLLEMYFRSLRVNRVDMDDPLPATEAEMPFIVLLYPVLRELERTSWTTHAAATASSPSRIPTTARPSPACNG
jgi:hypothetical protein